MSYDSEIQELLYDTITGDATLMANIDAVRLEDDVRTAPRLSSTVTCYLVIECLKRNGPIGRKNEFTQRALIHIYLKPEDRATKDAVLNRLSALFHNFEGGEPQSQSFETDSYVVFTQDGGVDKNPTEREKQQIIFYLNLSFLKK